MDVESCFCEKCGAENEGTNNYCKNCANPIKGGLILPNQSQQLQTSNGNEFVIPYSQQQNIHQAKQKKNGKGCLLIPLWIFFLPVMGIIAIIRSKNIRTSIKTLSVSAISLFCAFWILIFSLAMIYGDKIAYDNIQTNINNAQYIEAQEDINSFIKLYPESEYFDDVQALKPMVDKQAAAERAAIEKAASEKAASERAASEKAASERAASERAASEKAASEKAASEKAASEKADSEKAASEKTTTEITTTKKAEQGQTTKTVNVLGEYVVLLSSDQNYAIGASKANVKRLFSNFRITENYLPSYPYSIKFENKNLMICIDFNTNWIAEGAYVETYVVDDPITGVGSYVYKNYDKIVKLIIGNKNISVQDDTELYNSTGLRKYPTALFIGNYYE